MTINHVDLFRQKLATGKPLWGTCLEFADPSIAELMGDIGYDFVWIDGEHAALDRRELLGHVLACRGTGCAPLVRVPSADPVAIKPILELHPAGIIVPQVRTLAETAAAVASCQYPPVGTRGFGPIRGIGYGNMAGPDYLKTADAQIMVFVQIETREAVDNLTGILALEHLDGIAIGPNDLSGAYGKLGQTTDPEIVALIERVVRQARAAGKSVGMATGHASDRLKHWVEVGVQWIAINADFINLTLMSRQVLTAARHACGQPAPVGNAASDGYAR